MWASWIGSPDACVCVCVNRDGRGGKCVLPTVDKALDRLDQAILGDGIEEAYQIIVDCVEIHGHGCVLKVVVEMVPKLRSGKLPW